MNEIIQEIQNRFHNLILQDLTYNQLQKLNNNELFQTFKDIVKQKLQKTEYLKPEKVVESFIKLPITRQNWLLKEILLWNDIKIKELREDFGYGIYGVVLNYIKSYNLVKDLKIEIDKINGKNQYWLKDIWEYCIKNNQIYIFAENIITTLEESNTIRITENDVKFLTSLCYNHTATYVIESIRAISALIENKYVNDQTEVWKDLLKYSNPIVRTAVIEAIWQCQDKAMLPYLKELYEKELDDKCKKTCGYVIKVLEKL